MSKKFNQPIYVFNFLWNHIHSGYILLLLLKNDEWNSNWSVYTYSTLKASSRAYGFWNGTQNNSSGSSFTANECIPWLRRLTLCVYVMCVLCQTTMIYSKIINDNNPLTSCCLLKGISNDFLFIFSFYSILYSFQMEVECLYQKLLDFTRNLSISFILQTLYAHLLHKWSSSI